MSFTTFAQHAFSLAMNAQSASDAPPRISVSLLRQELLHRIGGDSATIERAEFIYEHRWRVGDLLLWDNRCTLHARRDFDPNENRWLRRVTIQGERPV